MKVELYGFEKFRNNISSQWYRGYVGITVFGKRFLGFSIFNDNVVVSFTPLESKPSTGIWLYIFFYNICIDIKDPWKEYDKLK